MDKKEQTKKTEISLLEILNDYDCPRCGGHALITWDGENVNCASCFGCWSKSAFLAVTKEAKG